MKVENLRYSLLPLYHKNFQKNFHLNKELTPSVSTSYRLNKHQEQLNNGRFWVNNGQVRVSIRQ